jgi:hypothetical protein
MYKADEVYNIGNTPFRKISVLRIDVALCLSIPVNLVRLLNILSETDQFSPDSVVRAAGRNIVDTRFNRALIHDTLRAVGSLSGLLILMPHVVFPSTSQHLSCSPLCVLVMHLHKVSAVTRSCY